MNTILRPHDIDAARPLVGALRLPDHDQVLYRWLIGESADDGWADLTWLTLRMEGFAGVVVFLESSVLLVNEPDYFTGEPRWTFPSGHMEAGEEPATAAVRELAEESGCVIDPAQLELVAISDVRQDGQIINRSWNYAASTSDAALAPRTEDDETVTEARWFNAKEAVEQLLRSTYPPKIEPVARFLTSGEHNLHWTFDLIDTSTPTPRFHWNPPVPGLSE